jgi:hypothetical protein
MSLTRSQRTQKRFLKIFAAREIARRYIGSPKTMPTNCRIRRYQASNRTYFCQRVEDNAFHPIEANASYTGGSASPKTMNFTDE